MNDNGSQIFSIAFSILQHYAIDHIILILPFKEIRYQYYSIRSSLLAHALAEKPFAQAQQLLHYYAAEHLLYCPEITLLLTVPDLPRCKQLLLYLYPNMND